MEIHGIPRSALENPKDRENMKVVINVCHGGFGLSEEAIERYIDLKGLCLYKDFDSTWKTNSYYTVPVEEYKRIANNDKKIGNYSKSNALTWSHYSIQRTDPLLVQVVEEMGENADSRYSSLKVVEIPDDVEWQIEEYDGSEWVAEKHRTWC
jgi:hypothetical protein